MNIQFIEQKFFTKKNYYAEDMNTLLDFIKQSYINNEIDILEYRKCLRELYCNGAHSPDDYVIHDSYL